MISNFGVTGAGEQLFDRRTHQHKGLAVLRRAAHALLALSERRRQRHALAALDDHLLRDIGLTRSAIRMEVSRPFWRV
jgi:uncharacterized protein YjiS (DUF1127 family)